MAIVVDTEVKTVSVDANIVQGIKDQCDIEGAAGRRLASSFLMTVAANSLVVLIFQKAPA